ncbi:MAG TPA: ribosome maturation factor RimP [Mycobacteriales bacterium]|jgi:ribosome maturation factor RimP|nr:ribosome maturation factor RimP [Mycobacteriales bacterium]
MTSGAGLRERVATVIRPAVTAVGCDLEQVTVSPAGKRKVVRVVVDADAGVTLDAVAAVSRAVTEVLDARDTELFGDSAYVLEVTSPGVDRPLTEPRHWRRAIGRLVEVPVDGTPVKARVAGADDDGVELEDESGTRTRYGWDQLDHGTVQVEFGRPTAENQVDETETENEDDENEDDEVGDDEEISADEEES